MSFDRKGYIKIENFFSKRDISNLLFDIKKNYEFQFIRHNLKGSFEENMIQLFNKNFTAFANCGKHNQHGNIDLYRLATSERIVETLKGLGLRRPSLSTRPVIMQNHKNLSMSDIHYKTPSHQDWGSIRGSKNSVVVWVPLMDVTTQEGPVNFIPKSHKQGLMESRSVGGFSTVEAKEDDFIFEEMNAGDILIFSTFLIHKSGEILNNKIRWSCHFRYNDMEEVDFINRDYHYNYIYKPIMEN